MPERHRIRAATPGGSTAEIDLTTAEPGSVTLLRALLSAAGFEVTHHVVDETDTAAMAASGAEPERAWMDCPVIHAELPCGRCGWPGTEEVERLFASHYRVPGTAAAEEQDSV
ncbi:hypothetical protein ACG83_10860 [Frankia sp. R43]|uniref:hypothetical protein n=1 Tax=Frankia sp. R43 TaxID=269536 RepID=UPI0006CA4D7B|nr:hypothetical protein [Frankia sp. R43]KPM55765.1 hypothetical protein ACG83_10860 [Frankia sp. R43]